MQNAYLIGISDYPNHRLASVPNDLALLQRALVHQEFEPDAIHTFGNEIGTLGGLRDVLATIRDDFKDVDESDNGYDNHCFFYFSGSGMLSLEPLRGGFKPIDGDDLDFRTALPFAELNDYLPIRPGTQVTVVLDC